MRATFTIGRLIVGTIAAASIAASPSYAAAPKKPIRKANPTMPKSEPAQCTKLRADYDNASKQLALSSAENVVDNSAVRSTMRNSQISNTIAQARMTFDIMKSEGCKLPNYTPSADRYGSQGLSCTVALQKQRAANAMARLNDSLPSFDTPQECDTSTWFVVE